jgi:HAD superfamily hydrolase (TIGR01509 family)
MAFEAVLFDIDGTLVDSNELHARCWIEIFAHYGKTFDYDTMFHQMGKGGDLLVPDLLNAKEMLSFGEEIKKKRGELYKEKYLPRVKPFPNVKRTFEIMHARGLKLALASSSNADEVEYYTDLLDIGDLLDGTTSKKDAKFSKPSPEIFAAALEKVDCDPSCVLIVGDTPYDILAGHRVPAAVAAVLSGGFERELLIKAEFLFDDVEELTGKLDLIDGYFND